MRSYMRVMQERSHQSSRGFAWGVAVSVLLHLFAVAAFLIHLPMPSPTQEETVSVDIVPEPEPEPEQAPEPEPEPEAEAPPEPEAPEPEPPEPETAEEEASPPEPPAPRATMLAIPPPVSDAPESETAMGNTAPERVEAPVETGPKAEETGEDASAPTAPDAQSETMDDAAADVAPEAAGEEAPEAAVDILAVEGEEGTEISIENPPVPLPRPELPAGAPETGTAHAAAGPLEPAERTFSDDRLVADPTLRDSLGQLPLSRRIVQLCAVEALSQIMAARPGVALHGMVPFADNVGKVENNTLDASGGAYRTMSGDWYDISFRCSVNPERMQVTDFSYRLGEKKITREERLARGLSRD
ncbi:DUF930 domain-containing protein [Rhizobiaceae bacterium BDR2-2]|uniref:DUF930 domain-containing protein n=1 Tax=Ectorhizobium quercum TaxID=2965071 RepID=A0AAE3STU2_9HYPH|nr:DUF930 domain-containing protein [Ectorhizobium quercum]MCX8996530.1 DUF930 domain-containing protein [Ectorhizobium quercum]